MLNRNYRKNCCAKKISKRLNFTKQKHFKKNYIFFGDCSVIFLRHNRQIILTTLVVAVEACPRIFDRLSIEPPRDFQMRAKLWRNRWQVRLPLYFGFGFFTPESTPASMTMRFRDRTEMDEPRRFLNGIKRCRNSEYEKPSAVKAGILKSARNTG